MSPAVTRPLVCSCGHPWQVVPLLASHGARVIRPYLRGFGLTRFLSDDTMRSGQQAALGSDVLALLDALGLEGAIVAGWMSHPSKAYRVLFNWQHVLLCHPGCSRLFSVKIQTFVVKACCAWSVF